VLFVSDHEKNARNLNHLTFWRNKHLHYVRLYQVTDPSCKSTKETLLRL